MIGIPVFPAWVDARHSASSLSLAGHAWIVSLGPSVGWAVVDSLNVEDAPAHYVAEFKNGEEQ